MNWKEFLASPQACIIALVLLFAVVRVFAPEPYYFVAVDEARYLGLAQNFPSHTLYAETRFLQHMPAYPYLIAITDFVLNNPVASGLLVSFVMGTLTLILLLVLFKNLNKKNTWLFLFALLFSLNWALVELSRLVFKETTYIAFFWATVVFYWLGIKKSSKWFWVSGVFAALTALSSDQVIFLFPMLLLTGYLMKVPWKQWRPYIPIVLGGIAYAFWLAIRLQFYLMHAAAPIGVDGVIEDTARFGLGQLLSPFSLPESARLTRAGYGNNAVQVVSNLGYLFNTYPFLITPNLSRERIGQVRLLDFLFILLVYVPIGLWLARWFWKKGEILTRERKWWFNDKQVIFALYWALLAVPILTGVGNWRHVILSVIPLLYFLTESLFSIFHKFMEKPPVRIGFALIAAFFVIAWVFAHPHLSFAREEVVQGYALAEELKTLPGDGFFVQTGYSMEQAYLLPEKRVYGIVSNASNLEVYLDKFNISYVVLGSKTWAPSDEPSLGFIKSRPDYFVPIKVVTEQYPLRNVAADRFVVYQVNQSLVPRNR